MSALIKLHAEVQEEIKRRYPKASPFVRALSFVVSPNAKGRLTFTYLTGRVSQDYITREFCGTEYLIKFGGTENETIR